MQEDPLRLYTESKRIIERQLAFWVHVAFYVGVNLILGIVNILSTPQFPWSLFPLLSWGLALYFHFIFGLVFHEGNVQKWKRALRSKRKAEALVILWIHAACYLGVNLFLVALDIITGNKRFWSIWPILGWGVGLLTHALCVWVFVDKYFKPIAARIQSEDLIEARVYFWVHFFTFTATNTVLFVINLLFFRRYLFSFWVFVGWGIGLFCHWLWLAANRGHRIKKWKQKKALELMNQLQNNRNI